MEQGTVIQVPLTWVLTFIVLLFAQMLVVAGALWRFSMRWAKVEEGLTWIQKLRDMTHNHASHITALKMAVELMLAGVQPDVVKRAMEQAEAEVS